MKYTSIDNLSRTAASIVNIDGWEGFSFEAVSGGFIVTGAVPIQQLWGEKTWPKQHTKVVVAESNAKEYYLDCERATGKCGDCDGTGKEEIGWSRETGTKRQECRRCKGSGRAPLGEREK